MSSEVLYVALYLCVAFFVIGIIEGISDGEFGVLAFGLGAFWPVTIHILLGAFILFGLMYLGKKIGEWIGG